MDELVLANVAVGSYNAIMQLVDDVLRRAGENAHDKRSTFIIALRMLATMRKGIMVAMAQVALRASLELGVPMEEIILEAFDPEDKSLKNIEATWRLNSSLIDLKEKLSKAAQHIKERLPALDKKIKELEDIVYSEDLDKST